MSAGDYRVGYKRPPKEYQFKSGSGNPRGRPKGVRDPDAVFRKVLNAKVTINHNGRKSKTTIREALVWAVLELSTTGDTRAMQWVSKLLYRFYAEQPKEVSKEESQRSHDELMAQLKQMATNSITMERMYGKDLHRLRKQET